MRINIKYNYGEDSAGKFLLIECFSRKTLLNSFKLSLNENNSELTERKKEIFINICKQYKKQGVSEKQVLREFAGNDDEMLKMYKKLYPYGGPRTGSGRRTNDPKTERFTVRCTSEEKQQLTDYLKELRAK